MQSSEGPWLSVSGIGPFLSFIKRTQQGGFTSSRGEGWGCKERKTVKGGEREKHRLVAFKKLFPHIIAPSLIQCWKGKRHGERTAYFSSNAKIDQQAHRGNEAEHK